MRKLVLIAMAAVVLGAQAVPAAADGAAVGYELVSPAEKNGYPIFSYDRKRVGLGLVRAASDGNSVVFPSWGTFAGAPSGMPTTYRARRTASGWTTQPVSPPPGSIDPQAVTLTSTWQSGTRDLSAGILQTFDFFDATDVIGAVDVYTQAAGGSPQLVSRGDGAQRTDSSGATYAGMSRDASHVAFTTSSQLVPEDVGRLDGQDVYVRAAGHTTLVNVDSQGQLLHPCGSMLGAGISGRTGAVSDDGSRIAFATPNPSSYVDPSCFDVQQLYLRDGDRTLQASASRRDTPDPSGTQPAVYRGMSADGSVVLFASSEMLTNDAPAGGGLYEFRPDTGAGSLTFVSGTEDSNMAYGGVVALSRDGTHLFFVSYRQLVAGKGEAGRQNLYVNVDGEITWLATNRSDVDLQGLGDAANVDESGRSVYTSPDGRHLVFATVAKLTSFDNADPDTGAGLSEVYRYSEGAGVTCVSCDPAGQRLPASIARSSASLGEGGSNGFQNNTEQVMSDDGSAVFFTTGDQLTGDDTNRRRDVYEYSDGRVHLISSGKSVADSYLIGSSSDASSVFFSTVDSLVPQDADGGNLDVYVARVGGGFPSPPDVTPPACADDACQGAVSPPPAKGSLGSTGVTGSGNATTPVRRTPAKKMQVKLTKLSSVIRTTRFAISVGAPAAGRISVSGASIRTVRKVVRRNGAYRILVSLDKLAAKRLASGARLRVKVKVAFTPASGASSSATTTVTIKKGR